jgi:hypothetical protein
VRWTNSCGRLLIDRNAEGIQMSANPPAPPTPPPLPPPPNLGPLGKPIRNWGNDDLLLEQEALDAFADAHPEAVPVFSWPALRDLFRAHDVTANSYRKKNRARGLIGAACGFSSLLITALTPVVAAENVRAAWVLGLAAILLAVAGGVIGYSGVLVGRSKWTWLGHRFWSERSRQLLFQLIVNNLALASRVVDKDASAKGEWDDLRARTMRDFMQRMSRDSELSLERMRDDLAEDSPWLEPGWAVPPPVPPESRALDTVFALLKRQRFDIQINYTERKLPRSIHSPRVRLMVLRWTVEILTVSALLLAVALGFLLVARFMPTDSAVRIIVAISGGMTAAVMTLRMLEEGLQLRAETERYEWYLAAVALADQRYQGAGTAQKVELLREMERLSYQELRRFTDGYANARFVM